MIVKIVQTASSLMQAYDIESDLFSLKGKIGSVSAKQKIDLKGEEVSIEGYYQSSHWVNYIPFRTLFGKEKVTRTVELFRNGKKHGSISLIQNGMFKQFYRITLDGEGNFHCYWCSKGSYNYVSIYHGDTQIALIETYLTVTDYKYVHTLYLLDEYSKFGDTLSFFVLYYANYQFAERLHMSKGTVYQKAWSISKYNHKFNPAWKETNFPRKSLLDRFADAGGENK
ncbi:MAG: hypothetical protein IJA58_02305 [Lachnospiraceae bacterium]|nr:hypothetical protein [Lachnospiraceae bacterium]